MKNTTKNKGIENNNGPVKDKYRIVGPLYDFLSNLYSGRSIHHCKIAMINKDNVKKGDRVLFAGVGHGLDAIQAAELGANVTVVDLSETMLNQFRQKLKKNNPKLKIRQVHSDILEFNEFKKYDMVVANFFLNVFYRETMTKVLEQLVRLGKPGAKIVVGDFTGTEPFFSSGSSPETPFTTSIIIRNSWKMPDWSLRRKNTTSWVLLIVTGLSWAKNLHKDGI